MQANKFSSKAIKEAFRKKIYRPYNQVKLAIVKKDMPEVGLLDDQSRTQLNGFLSSYPEDYTFQENSIYYDVMANPENHFKAFFRLAELSEAEQTKQFACFPLRTTFIPCYMMLDSKIIHYHGLKSRKNLKTGSRKLPKLNTEKKVDSNPTEHIEGLGQADLRSTEGKCVLIDPGRRDLMYCMKETSTVEEKKNTYIYQEQPLKMFKERQIFKKAYSTFYGPESRSNSF
ncbi:hypothetical protein G6F37_010423 [Rhizopus arrhizus]|nr:hypothetical protein G6F38_008162 [Rhizopus arrhizus]KAG1153365.1 hypothetical protein G6F37_010423 [Rhizopus arrhizus]